MYLEIITIFVSLFALLFYRKQRPKNFPPGPFSFPVVGNLLQLGLEPYKVLASKRKEYGDIIGVDFGSRQTVVVHTHKLIKEILALPALNGRPKLKHFAEIKTGINRGVVFTSGREWEEQRRFMVKNLRDFGFGRQSMESLIHEEIEELIRTLQKYEGKPINTSKQFYLAMINALWRIAMGERQSLSDPKTIELVDHISEYTSSTKSLSLFVFFPGFATFFPGISGFNEFIRHITPVYEFVTKAIVSHRETYQDDYQRDIIDCYLREIKNTTDPKSSFYKTVGEQSMLVGLHDVFIAGAEPTSTGLTWILFLLAHYPEVQEKVHEHVKDVVGFARLPSLNDKKDLPFVEAVVMEVLRYSTILPMGVFRENLEDIVFHGYFIPKGTLIHANLHSVHYDPQIWGDPEKFRPERFIMENGSADVRNEAFLPFGAGTRICPGESMARDELFLFTASLFQKFRFEFDPNEPIPTLNPVLGKTVLMPVEHKLILHDRF